MFANLTREEIYSAYRLRLHALLGIPTDARDQDIHGLIDRGFSVDTVRIFFDAASLTAKEYNQVIALKTLKTKVRRAQCLTAYESEFLYRFAHILSMAEALFGDDEKSRRWLSKPKNRLSGRSPISMLSSTIGAREVEEMLAQMAEGFAF